MNVFSECNICKFSFVKRFGFFLSLLHRIHSYKTGFHCVDFNDHASKHVMHWKILNLIDLWNNCMFLVAQI